MRARSVLPSILATCVVLLLGGPPARAGGQDAASVPGYVDGTAFGSLAGEDSDLVEIHLGPTILGAIARGKKEDPDTAALLGGLRSVSAYIVGLKGDADRTEKAAKLFHGMERRLEQDGWERLATVREKGDRVNVFVLGGDGTVKGLVVLVLDTDEGEVVFANLAGTIDLAKIDEIGDTLDVPGLDELSGKKKTQDGGTRPDRGHGEAP